MKLAKIELINCIYSKMIKFDVNAKLSFALVVKNKPGNKLNNEIFSKYYFARIPTNTKRKS